MTSLPTRLEGARTLNEAFAETRMGFTVSPNTRDVAAEIGDLDLAQPLDAATRGRLRPCCQVGRGIAVVCRMDSRSVGIALLGERPEAPSPPRSNSGRARGAGPDPCR